MLTRLFTLGFLSLLLQISSTSQVDPQTSGGDPNHSHPVAVSTESRSPHEMSPFDWVMLSLGLLALIPAGIALWYADKQKRDADRTLSVTTDTANNTKGALAELAETRTSLSHLTTQLLLITNQLSTRYVGKFPENLRAITELLRIAQKSIAIIVDFAGYSSYTDSSAFREYFYAIESSLRTNPNLSVRLYLYDSLLHQQLLQLAFPRAHYQEEMFNKPSDPLIIKFLARMEKRQITIRDYDSFITALLDDEERCVQQFTDLERCNCFELQKKVPIFLWMVDDCDCIFAFENEQGQGKNYFSFRTRDGSLIDYFLHYMKDIMAQTNQPPSRTVEDVSEMSLLVPQLGLCQKINGRLVPCKYHRDRLDVRHYQQTDTTGESDKDDELIEVAPTAASLELFELMDDKRMPAGDWSLMKAHRSWLTERVCKALGQSNPSEEHTRAILQLGSAGPIHYFSTAKVIEEALLSATIPSNEQVDFITRDRCLTPVACVNFLLNQIETQKAASAPNEWAMIDTEGLRRNLDPSFYDICAEQLDMPQRLRHNIGLGDICDVGFLKGLQPFDLVIAHFTFSMWAGTPIATCTQGYKNIAGALKSGGKLLAALSEFHNPAVTSLDHYHQSFADVGLHLVGTTRTWDVYDLSVAERHRLLYSRTPQFYRKRVILAEYEKTKG